MEYKTTLQMENPEQKLLWQFQKPKAGGEERKGEGGEILTCSKRSTKRKGKRGHEGGFNLITPILKRHGKRAAN